MRCILFSSLALARALVKVETDEVDARSTSPCIEKGEVEKDYTMNLSMYTDFNITTLTVPALPTDPDTYRYATDHALVALPAQCVTEFASSINKAADLPNKNACDPQGMKYVRISDITDGWATLKKMTGCSKGLVVGFHGSGGPGWGQVQYAIIFSGLGYIHIQLDSMAMPLDLGLKGRSPQAGEDIETNDYCGDFKPSQESCSSFSKPYCYSSKEEVILAQPDDYRKFVEGVYQIRKREMDYFVEQGVLEAFSKIYAVGNSEGAMILNRYYSKDFHDRLSGMIFDGWSCEFNYFLPCQDAAKICENNCEKTIPVLNLIGDEDNYFGVISTSLAQKVKAAPSGYGADTITGNCHAQFKSQEFEKRTTVIFKNAGHTPKYWNDNLVRAVVLDFIGGQSQSWKSKYSCQETTANEGLFECDNPEFATCKPNEICECCDESRSTTYTMLASYLLMSLFCAHVW